MSAAPISIVGGGPVGTVMALLLARRGRRVRILERRADPRMQAAAAGRSINLALAARGLRALQFANVLDAVRPQMLRMSGRVVHDIDGRTQRLAYGQKPDEVIWSISRAVLNRVLIEAAAEQPLIELHFDAHVTDIDVRQGQLTVGGMTDDRAVVIAADGAGSTVRAAMQEQHLCQANEAMLEHDYKELHIAAGPGGSHRLELDGLHIWPRGGFMLIALPNIDGSFTATLFLVRSGAAESFAALQDGTTIQAFFARHFADVLPLLPDLVAQFVAHPQARLGTVRCWPWHVHNTLLIGDAAHAIVPFHGQGLNCGFEDCLLLDDVMAHTPQVEAAFARFEHERRLDTDAIATMALENYQEMRDSVAREDFIRRRELALRLERLYPTRFIPRYAMVMFHPEISYAEALHRGITQERLLDVLLAAGSAADSAHASTVMDDAGL